MDEQTLRLRRARRVHSVWLSTCRVWSLDQKVIVLLAATRGPCYSTSVLQYMLQYLLPFPNPKRSALPPLRRHSLARKNREGRGRGREEKKRKTRARLRRSSSFLSKNRLGFLSSFHFPHLHGFFLAVHGGAALCGVVQRGWMQGRRGSGVESP